MEQKPKSQPDPIAEILVSCYRRGLEIKQTQEKHGVSIEEAVEILKKQKQENEKDKS